MLIPGCLLAALGLVFGALLFMPAGTLLSIAGTDISSQFLFWRDFGFREWRAGNLALWNPHIFAGAPFFAGFQSALLYPPNAIFLILPVGSALTASILLHGFLTGFFMFLWARGRGLLPATALFAGLLLMFSGAFHLHIAAGHLTNLCAMPWAILLFALTDRLLGIPNGGTPPARPGLLIWTGAAIVAMQILAGHPQYVFYTAVALTLYTAAGALLYRRPQPLAGIALMYAGGALLSAVQLASGFDASAESIRGGGLPFAFASMFSFPPENLLTLLAPDFFGNLRELAYWGRCYLWEMSLFLSVTALPAIALTFGRPRSKPVTMALLTSPALLLLALGRHTPLFELLYRFVPGFDLFRGISKFAFFLVAMLAMLAASGLDRLIRHPPVRATRWIGGLAIATAITLLLTATMIAMAGHEGIYGAWGDTLRATQTSGEAYVNAASTAGNPAFVKTSAALAARSLLWAATTLAVVGLLLLGAPHLTATPYLLIIIGIVEILGFARANLFTMPPEAALPQGLHLLASTTPPPHRVLVTPRHNAGMSTGVLDLWGMDPGVSRRYAEWMTHTQEPDRPYASQYLTFHHLHPRYAMLRLAQGVLTATPNQVIPATQSPLPHAFLVSRFQVLTDRAAIFAALDREAFDPAREVILERMPLPYPQGEQPDGWVRLTDQGTDHLTFEAALNRPAILVITDGYARGWRATGTSVPAQARYDVLPANYILRAIPLAAGSHHLTLRYEPQAFIAGKWISLAAATLWLAAGGWLARRPRTPRPPPSAPTAPP